jgi:glycerol uptake facilitator-like aquaporin
MNPALNFGGAMVGSLLNADTNGAGFGANQWIYWAGDTIGAIIAALVYKSVLCSP